MRIHILGICGTFMGSLALLARDLGHQVSGSDAGVYPPMSTQLAAAGIALYEGYSPAALKPHPELVIVGNAVSRGNPAVEYVLDQGIPYLSGPAWLAQEVLATRHVLAVAGTHGKTTTTTMLTWILQENGLQPGWLIGGVPVGLASSAALGDSRFFVIEADEYDTAFFDKRSKFVHYHPRTLILNNLEYDHADIFPDLAAIQTQFHHLVRTVPGTGLIISPASDPSLQAVLRRGVWSRQQTMAIADSAADWSMNEVVVPGQSVTLCRDGQAVAQLPAGLHGAHTRHNALMAIIAAADVGVSPKQAVDALATFPGVKRRMELLGTPHGIAVYDDFAHHPTAVATTLQGLREQTSPDTRIIAVIEPRSNTMRLGIHQQALADCIAPATLAFWYQPPQLTWDLHQALENATTPSEIFSDLDRLLQRLLGELRRGDQVVIMSNGSFGGLHQQLLQGLTARA